MRSAEKDLALCDKATPGPWVWFLYNRHNRLGLAGENRKKAVMDHEGNFLNTFDADFIAAAREALPYWIKRAMVLEKALRWACEVLEMESGCPNSEYGWSEDDCEYEGCDLENSAWRRPAMNNEQETSVGGIYINEDGSYFRCEQIHTRTPFYMNCTFIDGKLCSLYAMPAPGVTEADHE